MAMTRHWDDYLILLELERPKLESNAHYSSNNPLSFFHTSMKAFAKLDFLSSLRAGKVSRSRPCYQINHADFAHKIS